MLDELDTNNFIASFDADDADLDVSFDLEPTPLQPFQSGADLGDEPAPIVPTADPAGAAIPQPQSIRYRGGAITREERDFATPKSDAFLAAELTRIEREHQRTLQQAEEVRRRHHVKSLGGRRRVHRGASRERRPGPCRASGSRRSRATSSRARSPGSLDPDLPPDHIAALGRLPRKEAAR